MRSASSKPVKRHRVADLAVGEPHDRPAGFVLRDAHGRRVQSSAVAVLLIGTLDTKGDELGFVRDRLLAAGVQVILADVSTQGPPHGAEPDITREQIVPGAASLSDRGAAMSAMAAGARALAAQAFRRRPRAGCAGHRRLGRHHDRHRRDAGSTAGRPQADGQHAGLRQHAASSATKTCLMLNSIVDIAGLNRISRAVLAEAAAAMAGLVRFAHPPVPSSNRATPLLGAPPCSASPRPASSAGGDSRKGRLRGARLPRHRHRRHDDGVVHPRRAHRRRARHHDDRAGGRAGRRRAHGRAGPADRRAAFAACRR